MRLSAKFKISLSRESFLGRTQFNACGPQTTVFHFNVSDERSSEEICKYFTDVCFRQNSDQFTARTFNDERFAEMFVADALAQTRSITNISVTDDLKLEMSRARSTARCEGNFVRVAAEHGFQIFTKSTTVNHVRVTSTDMPYHGANFHGRGLKIRLCGLTVSTGALNAVEIYVKKKRKIRKMF